MILLELMNIDVQSRIKGVSMGLADKLAFSNGCKTWRK